VVHLSAEVSVDELLQQVVDDVVVDVDDVERLDAAVGLAQHVADQSVDERSARLRKNHLPQKEEIQASQKKVCCHSDFVYCNAF
jgi:hypothetical protein